MEQPAATEETLHAEPLAWYCLLSQPKHEKIAAVHLRKNVGVEVFSPSIRFQQSRLKGKAWMTEALFPGYVFAKFDPVARWRQIQYAHAIRGILRFGEKYPEVPTDIIEHIRAEMGPEEICIVDQAVEEGQGVVVSDGAFRGLETVITCHMPAKDRVKVLMNMLGREMEVELATSSLAPVLSKHPLKFRQQI